MGLNRMSPAYLAAAKGMVNPDSPRFTVDGNTIRDRDGDEYLDGAGQFPPFRIFDAELQTWIGPPYETREAAAEGLAAMVESLNG